MPIDRKPPYGTPLKKDWHTQGLVGFWGMQEGGGLIVHDLSGYNNHGTMIGMDNPSSATSGWTAGRTGKGLSFDGVNDYVEVGNISESTTYTLSAWFNTSSVSPDDLIGHRIITIFRSGQTSTKIALFMRNNKASIQYYTTSAASLSDTVNSNNGLWHSLIATYDGVILKLYVDGILKNSATITLTSNVSDSSDIIGRGITASPGYFNGLIDDIRIYNRALTAGEVWESYIRPYDIWEDRRNTRYFVLWWNKYADTLQDSLTVADSRSKQANIAKSDSLYLADVFSKQVSITKNDSLNLADTISKQANVFKNDALSLADSVTRQANIVKGDNVQLTDTFGKQVDIVKNDQLYLADTVSKQANITKSDSLHIEEVFGKQASIVKNDQLYLVDAFGKQVDIVKSDILYLSDAFSKEINIFNSDIINLAETFIKQLNIVNSDSLTITDIFIKHLDVNFSDNISFTEGLSTQGVYFDLLLDYINLSDTTQKTVHISRTEDVGFADSAENALDAVLSDNIHISDQMSTEGDTELNDSVVFADSHSDIVLRDREVHIRLHIKRV